MFSLGILSTAFYGYCLTHFYYSFRYNINLLDYIKKYNKTMQIQNSINNFNSATPYRDSIEYKSDMLNELRNRFNNINTNNSHDNNYNSLSETDISDNEYEIVN